MLRGDKAGLRARQAADLPVLQAELHGDIETWSRTNSGPWRPLSPDLEDSPFALKVATDSVATFSIVDLKSEDVAGGATLWGIDRHNRNAHLGLSLRPSFRGRGLGTDVVRILVRYGFTTLGLRRLGLETLSDNHAMIRAATSAGFTREGTLREAGWVNGAFVDEVVFGLLADEYQGD
jgi:RimJ/RimL family protein N-acetyltransferase